MHVAEDARPLWCSLNPSRRCPTFGAHVAADAQPQNADPSRHCSTSALTSLQTLSLGNPSRTDLGAHVLLRLTSWKSHGAARPVGAHLAADAQPRGLQLPHGAARPVGAHVPADAQPLCCGSSRRCLTPRRSQTFKVGLPNHLKPWEAGGFKAGLHHRRLAARLHRDRPVRVPRATLPEWLSRCTSVQTLNLELPASHLTALPDLSALTSLQRLDLTWLQLPHGCPTSRRSRR